MKLTYKRISQMPPAQQLLMFVLMRRGVELEVLNGTEIIRGKLNNIERNILGGYTSLVPLSVGMVLTNKYFTRQVLTHARIDVAKGRVFAPDQHRQAGWYAEEELSYPVMIRQENSQRDDKALMNLHSRKEVVAAYCKLAMLGENILVEQMVEGTKLLISASSDGYVGAWQVEILPELKIPDQTRSIIRSEMKRLTLLAGDFQMKPNRSAHLPFEYQHRLYSRLPECIDAAFVKNVGQRVLKAFPGLPTVTFEVIVPDRKHSHDSSFVVTEVFHSVGPVMFMQLQNTDTQKRGVDVLADLLF